MSYRNRPDRRRAPLLAAMSVLGMIDFGMTTTDGQHFEFSFSEPVTFDGNLNAFRFWNVTETAFFFPIGYTMPDATTIVFDMGGATLGEYVVTPQQPLNSILGYTGNLLVGTPLQAAV